MDRKSTERILNIQERIQSDSVLMEEYNTHHARFLQMQNELTKSQQEILMNYLGICIEIHLKMLEEATK